MSTKVEVDINTTLLHIQEIVKAAYGVDSITELKNKDISEEELHGLITQAVEDIATDPLIGNLSTENASEYAEIIASQTTKHFINGQPLIPESTTAEWLPSMQSAYLAVFDTVKNEFSTEIVEWQAAPIIELFSYSKSYVEYIQFTSPQTFTEGTEFKGADTKEQITTPIEEADTVAEAEEATATTAEATDCTIIMEPLQLYAATIDNLTNNDIGPTSIPGLTLAGFECDDTIGVTLQATDSNILTNNFALLGNSGNDTIDFFLGQSASNSIANNTLSINAGPGIDLINLKVDAKTVINNNQINIDLGANTAFPSGDGAADIVTIGLSADSITSNTINVLNATSQDTVTVYLSAQDPIANNNNINIGPAPGNALVQISALATNTTTSSTAQISNNNITIGTSAAGALNASVQLESYKDTTQIIKPYIQNNQIEIYGRGTAAETVNIDVELIAAQLSGTNIIPNTGGPMTGNTININVSDSADANISVNLTAGDTQTYTKSFGPFTFTLGLEMESNDVLVIGGSGSDDIDISLRASQRIDENTIQASGNDGNDEIFLGIGVTDTTDFAGIFSNIISLSGGSGSDTVEVSLFASGVEGFLSYNTISLLGGADNDLIQAHLQVIGDTDTVLMEFNVLSALGSSGDDTILIDLTLSAITGSTGAHQYNHITAQGGTGDDTIDVTLRAYNQSNTFAAAYVRSAQILIEGNEGNDLINLDMVASDTNATGYNPNLPSNNVVINAGDGSDTVSVLYTATAIHQDNFIQIDLGATGTNIGDNAADEVTLAIQGATIGSHFLFFTWDANSIYIDNATNLDNIDIQLSATNLARGTDYRDIMANTIVVTGTGNVSLDLIAKTTSGITDATISANNITLSGQNINLTLQALQSNTTSTKNALVQNNNITLQGNNGTDIINASLAGIDVLSNTVVLDGDDGLTDTLSLKINDSQVAQITNNNLRVMAGNGTDNIDINLTAQNSINNNDILVDLETIATVTTFGAFYLGPDQRQDTVDITLNAPTISSNNLTISNSNSFDTLNILFTANGQSNAEIINNNINNTANTVATAGGDVSILLTANTSGTTNSVTISNNTLQLIGENLDLKLAADVSNTANTNIGKVNNQVIDIEVFWDIKNNFNVHNVNLEADQANSNTINILGERTKDTINVTISADALAGRTVTESINNNTISIDSARGSDNINISLRNAGDILSNQVTINAGTLDPVATGSSERADNITVAFSGQSLVQNQINIDSVDTSDTALINLNAQGESQRVINSNTIEVTGNNGQAFINLNAKRTTSFTNNAQSINSNIINAGSSSQALEAVSLQLIASATTNTQNGNFNINNNEANIFAQTIDIDLKATASPADWTVPTGSIVPTTSAGFSNRSILSNVILASATSSSSATINVDFEAFGQVKNNQITVNGNNQADSLDVKIQNDGFAAMATVPGPVFFYLNAGQIESNTITINGLDGNDVINFDLIQSGLVWDTPTLTDKSSILKDNLVNINAGTGNDTINITVQNTTNNITSNTISVNAGDGSDTINIEFLASGNGIITPTAEGKIITGNDIDVALGSSDSNTDNVTIRFSGDLITNNNIAITSATSLDNISIELNAFDPQIISNTINIQDAPNLAYINLLAQTSGANIQTITNNLLTVGDSTSGAQNITVNLYGSGTNYVNIGYNTLNLYANAYSGNDASIDINVDNLAGPWAYFHDNNVNIDIKGTTLVNSASVNLDFIGTYFTSNVFSLNASGNNNDHITLNLSSTRFDQNTFVINDNEGNDTIHLKVTNNLSGNAFLWQNQITINPGTGNDSINIELNNSGTGNAWITSNTIRVDAGAGSDNIDVKLHNTSTGFSTIYSNDIIINGGLGSDVINLTLSGDTATWVNIDFNLIEINADASDDTVNLLLSLNGSGSMNDNSIEINGGSGNDVLSAQIVAPSKLTRNTLDINGSDGSDIINMTLSADIIGRTAGFVYRGHIFNIDAGNNDDQVTININAQNSANSNTLIINGGTGSDTIDLNLNYQAGSSNSIVISAGSGADLVNISIGANTASQLNANIIQINDAESVQFTFNTALSGAFTQVTSLANITSAMQWVYTTTSDALFYHTGTQNIQVADFNNDINLTSGDLSFI